MTKLWTLRKKKISESATSATVISVVGRFFSKQKFNLADNSA